MHKIIIGDKVFDCPTNRTAVMWGSGNGREWVTLVLLGDYDTIKAAFVAGVGYRHEWGGGEGRSYSKDLSQYGIPGEITDCRDGSFLLTMYAPTAADKLAEVGAALRSGVDGCMAAEAPAMPDVLAQAAYTGGRSQALALAAEAPELTGTEIIDREGFVPEWRPGPYAMGGLVQRSSLDQVYRVLQAHDSSASPDWTPETLPALFGVCHTTNPTKAKPWAAPQGNSGLYQQGECYKDAAGMVWRQTYEGANEYDAAAQPDRWERVDA